MERLVSWTKSCWPYLSSCACPTNLNGSYVQLSSLQMSEMSMDSGRGTIATVNSTRSSTSSRGRPMPAFPIAKVQSQISEDEEQSGHSGRDRGQGHPWSQGGQRQPPPSPPVRERDRSVHILRVLSNCLCEASLGIIVQGCRNCNMITMMTVQFEH